MASQVLKTVILLAALLLPAFLSAQTGAARGEEVLRVDLEGAIRMGSARNFNLQNVKNRARSVNARVNETWAAYLPSASVSIDRTRAILTDEVDSRATEVRLNLEQVLYDGGQRELDLGLARLEKSLLGHLYRRDSNQLRVDIQSAFLGVLAARGKVALNRRSLWRAREQLRLSMVEEKVGFATRTEVFLVAARVREIELALQRARNAEVRALYGLKLAMNLDPDIVLEPVGDLFSDFVYDPPHVSLDRLVGNARQAHPEVLQSHADVYRRLKEKQIAERTWIPRVTVGGYVGRAGEEYPVSNQTWGVSFGVSFPFSSSSVASTGSLDVAGNGTSRTGISRHELNLYDNPASYRTKLDARTAYAQSVADHKQVVNRVTIDVEQRYRELTEAWESIRIGNGRVYFQLASMKDATAQYRVGQTRRADILLNEVDLVQAQEDLTDDLARYLIAAYALEFAGAVEPGSLALYEFDPGHGNTLLAHLLKEDFESIREIKPETDPFEPGGDYFEDRYEIDRIQLDENTRREEKSPGPAGPGPALRDRIEVVPATAVKLTPDTRATAKFPDVMSGGPDQDSDKDSKGTIDIETSSPLNQPITDPVAADALQVEVDAQQEESNDNSTE